MVISELHLPGCYIVAEASAVSISNRNTWHRPAVPRDLLLLPCKLDYNDAGTPFAELYAEPRVAGLSLNDNHLPLTCWNGRKLLGTMRLPRIVSGIALRLFIAAQTVFPRKECNHS